MGSKIRLTFLFLSHCTDKASFQNCLRGPFKPPPMLFMWDVSLGYEIQDVKPQIKLDQICSKYLQDLLYGRSYF